MCLHGILNVSWHDKVSNEEVLQRAWQMPLGEQVKYQCLHFLGHVLGMNQVHTARHTLEWIPAGGKQWHG